VYNIHLHKYDSSIEFLTSTLISLVRDGSSGVR
jgi:hypothetical protein